MWTHHSQSTFCRSCTGRCVYWCAKLSEEYTSAAHVSELCVHVVHTCQKLNKLDVEHVCTVSVGSAPPNDGTPYAKPQFYSSKGNTTLSDSIIWRVLNNYSRMVCT